MNSYRENCEGKGTSCHSSPILVYCTKYKRRWASSDNNSEEIMHHPQRATTRRHELKIQLENSMLCPFQTCPMDFFVNACQDDDALPRHRVVRPGAPALEVQVVHLEKHGESELPYGDLLLTTDSTHL